MVLQEGCSVEQPTLRGAKQRGSSGKPITSGFERETAVNHPSRRVARGHGRSRLVVVSKSAPA